MHVVLAVLGVIAAVEGVSHAVTAAPSGRSAVAARLAAARLAAGPPPERPRVAVNLASEEELCSLPGIGPKRAAQIVAARERRPFRSAADLRRIRGIGPKGVRRLGPLLDYRTAVPTPPDPPARPPVAGSESRPAADASRPAADASRPCCGRVAEAAQVIEIPSRFRYGSAALLGREEAIEGEPP
ncbi:MAG: helix-hairpin-helix domain-containing protein [Deltaproteobacteria bacterium]|nr:helix-hairpin-helix domain-containing protein [Deltaproteobacteria bacterium]